MNNIIVIIFQIYLVLLFVITFMLGVVLIILYALTRKHRGINYDIIFKKILNISQNPIKLNHQIKQEIITRKYKQYYQIINDDLYLILKNNDKLAQQYIQIYLLLKEMNVSNIDDTIIKLIIINCNL